MGIFCVFKTIGSCHSYVIDETEDVLRCLECCLSFVGNPRDFFLGGGVDFCPHSRNGVTMYTVAYRVLTE